MIFEEMHCKTARRNDKKKMEEEKGKECCPAGTPNCPGPGNKLGEPGPHEGLSKNKELEEAAKPDFPDVDGDGDTEEPISQAQNDKKQTEKSSGKDKDLSKEPPQLRKHVAKKMAESKIQTPEQEQKLYESRFNKRNEEIFDKLKKLWTK